MNDRYFPLKNNLFNLLININQSINQSKEMVLHNFDTCVEFLGIVADNTNLIQLIIIIDDTPIDQII